MHRRTSIPTTVLITPLVLLGLMLGLGLWAVESFAKQEATRNRVSLAIRWHRKGDEYKPGIFSLEGSGVRGTTTMDYYD